MLQMTTNRQSSKVNVSYDIYIFINSLVISQMCSHSAGFCGYVCSIYLNDKYVCEGRKLSTNELTILQERGNKCHVSYSDIPTIHTFLSFLLYGYTRYLIFVKYNASIFCKSSPSYAKTSYTKDPSILGFTKHANDLWPHCQDLNKIQIKRSRSVHVFGNAHFSSSQTVIKIGCLGEKTIMNIHTSWHSITVTRGIYTDPRFSR